MKKLTYQQNERRQKARLISRLLDTWASLEIGEWRNRHAESQLAGQGMFDLNLGQLTPEGQRVVDAVLEIDINEGTKHDTESEG